MDVVDAPRRAPYGRSLLVALGWYATVITAVVVGQSGIPAAPRTDCSVMFSCLTPQEEIGLLLLVGSPVLLGLLVCTLVVTGLLARLIPSPIVVGTLSVLGSVAVVAVVVAVWQGAR
ncbi:hypothetical protein O7621_00830 [Solwaraspora sp. WMMD937]|uniref:hypothetical protein n=1 Tax=Solwaraspora sp. WMMD937 TaxID=3016090 RepID=UPI00249C5F73|nr:hypothetical protein [Solwaraspora sp. WMMD937]WFE21965.1 hypothetical protein O7621_00830 [Solwaraspora sp. WMMD937]